MNAQMSENNPAPKPPKGPPKGPPKRPRGRPRSVEPSQPASLVQALDRGLQVLRHLAEQEGGVTLTNLALTASAAPSSVHRTLMTLQKHGFAEFDEQRQTWAIGLEAFRVGSTYLSRTNLVNTASEIMRRLTDETGETSNLAIADDGDVVFISQVETHHAIRAFFRPGTRSLMHASGIGKALLSHYGESEVEAILANKGLQVFTGKTLATADALRADLQKAREQAWAFDDEEHFDGMRCIAAAIFDASARPIAGISISGPTVRLTDHTQGTILRVARAARAICSLLATETLRSSSLFLGSVDNHPQIIVANAGILLANLAELRIE